MLFTSLFVCGRVQGNNRIVSSHVGTPARGVMAFVTVEFVIMPSASRLVPVGALLDVARQVWCLKNH